MDSLDQNNAADPDLIHVLPVWPSELHVEGRQAADPHLHLDLQHQLSPLVDHGQVGLVQLNALCSRSDGCTWSSGIAIASLHLI